MQASLRNRAAQSDYATSMLEMRQNELDLKKNESQVRLDIHNALIGLKQARARYDAGLTSILEVAEAQSLLAQAEVQDELARVDVWRALLTEAVAQGDLTSFVAQVRQP